MTQKHSVPPSSARRRIAKAAAADAVTDIEVALFEANDLLLAATMACSALEIEEGEPIAAVLKIVGKKLLDSIEKLPDSREAKKAQPYLVR